MHEQPLILALRKGEIPFAVGVCKLLNCLVSLAIPNTAIQRIDRWKKSLLIKGIIHQNVANNFTLNQIYIKLPTHFYTRSVIVHLNGMNLTKITRFSSQHTVLFNTSHLWLSLLLMHLIWKYGPYKKPNKIVISILHAFGVVDRYF